MIAGLERQMGCADCSKGREESKEPATFENCKRCQRLLDEHAQLKQELHYAYWTTDTSVYTFDTPHNENDAVMETPGDQLK